jgi:RNA ligase
MTASPIHPARQIGFSELVVELDAARASTLVYRRDDPATGRSLYCYTSRCVYAQAWDKVTMLARGLILDLDAGRVVATPFPKFFNFGEGARTMPNLPFETYDKLDGSLAIIHFAAGKWRAATKGDLFSAQALWAEARLDAQDTSALVPGTTYLAECIGPHNRIVVRYPDAALVLLAAFAEDGTEMSRGELEAVADRLGWPVASRRLFSSFAELVGHADALPATSEGFVIRYADGTRLKLKGSEYRRIHALIARCTPLGVWQALAAGDDTEAIRRDLPEEFWSDFDDILRLLRARLADLESRIGAAAFSVAHLSDKELGLALRDQPADVRGHLFAWRKSGGKLTGKSLQSALREVRPTGDVLPGYRPSSALDRLLAESS